MCRAGVSGAITSCAIVNERVRACVRNLERTLAADKHRYVRIVFGPVRRVELSEWLIAGVGPRRRRCDTHTLATGSRDAGVRMFAYDA